MIKSRLVRLAVTIIIVELAVLLVVMIASGVSLIEEVF